jgi:hypothetical protein
MVMALLAGTKTQTRRIIKTPDVRDHEAFAVAAYVTKRDVMELGKVVGHRDVIVPCPYGQPGEKLWVKETFAAVYDCPAFLCECEEGGTEHRRVVYRATEPNGISGFCKSFEDGSEAIWRPSLFMPRWASRIALEVTEVRIERLHDISEEDALAEGVECVGGHDVPLFGPKERLNPSEAYADLWDSINGEGAWALNPWVWCVSFRRAT